jgi:hypothetical protein
VKFILPIFALLSTCLVEAQKEKETFYLFDHDWNGVQQVEKATYLMHVFSQKDTLFIARTYNKNGSMIRQESYKDGALTLPHGRFLWYDEEGIDSTGMVNERKKTGEWYYYNDTLGINMLVKYNNGKEIERKDFHRKKIITRAGEFDIAEDKKDTALHVKMEKEAVFKGGSKAYSKWLVKNIQVPERTSQLDKNGEVRFQFIINKEGYIENIVIIKSLEWAADKESLRVLSAMPQWEQQFKMEEMYITRLFKA